MSPALSVPLQLASAIVLSPLAVAVPTVGEPVSVPCGVLRDRCPMERSRAPPRKLAISASMRGRVSVS